MVNRSLMSRKFPTTPVMGAKTTLIIKVLTSSAVTMLPNSLAGIVDEPADVSWMVVQAGTHTLPNGITLVVHLLICSYLCGDYDRLNTGR